MKVAELAEDTLHKEAALKELLASYGSILIAYSGGVDSTYLADVAHDVLGEAARLVLADAPSLPRSELRDAVRIAAKRGWNLTVIETKEFEDDTFLDNSERRCYFCKNIKLASIGALAKEWGIETLAHGENVDDTRDTTRFGAQATHEHGVVGPMMEVGLSKAEIRLLSRARGLPTWDKPSYSCLATRFPTGHRLNIEELGRVEEAEETLKSCGFRQFRARHHGELCRIELELAELTRALDPELREQIVARFSALGYRHVTLDLAGYRSGSTAG